MVQPRIYLIAGHQVVNNKGTGAHSPYGDEAVLAHSLRDDIAAELRAYGHQVVTDVSANPLNAVLRWLRPLATGKDVVIDIHFNSAANPQANGTEVIIPRVHTHKEMALAIKLSGVIAQTLGTRLRRGKIIHAGVKDETETAHGRIAILSQISAPTSVLLEICFLSNYDDMTKFFENRHLLVRQLAKAISEYLHGR